MAAITLQWPTIPAFTSAAFGVSNRLDATTDDFAVVMYAEEDCTITDVVWMQSNISTATPGTLRIGLQSVSTTGGTGPTSGLPTGTWLASGNGYADKSSWSTGDNGLYITSTLGSSVTLARGDVFAIVLKPQATGTWGASNWVDVGYFVPNDLLYTTPYIVTDGTKLTTARTPNTIVRSSTRAYGFPYESLDAWTCSTNTSPNQIGVKFVVPAGVCDTFQVSGIAVLWDITFASSFTIALYEDTNRTALQSIVVDSDQTGTQAALGVNMFYFDNSTLSNLTAGTTYRVMIEAGVTTSAGNIRYVTLDQASDMTAYIGSSATYHWTEWGGSSYTDRTSQFPLFSLILSDITEPSGGGGAYPIFGGMVVK
jgi:hypothetical protein